MYDFAPQSVRKILIIVLFFVISTGFLLWSPSAAPGQAPGWKQLQSGKTASFRGICAVSAQVCWVSGTQGTVLRTLDGGEHWESVGPPNCDELDFRDIEAWDENSALIMSSGEQDRLYRTTDGGRSWNLVFEHPDRNAFFDGISFANSERGWLMGDPLKGQILILETIDSGQTWSPLPLERLPEIESGEAGFAASGTHLVAFETDGLAIALGGAEPGTRFPTSRIVRTANGGRDWTAQITPLPRSESSGLFSLCRVDDQNWVAVGGDYKRPAETNGTAVWSSDAGQTWQAVSNAAPSGYRSAVAVHRTAAGETVLIAVGPNGTDRSFDLGRSWTPISTEGFHTLDFTPDHKAGWAAGADGRIARWSEN
jgi:photosystem II stability/assembly factor-like uncharacterized protein